MAVRTFGAFTALAQTFGLRRGLAPRTLALRRAWFVSDVVSLFVPASLAAGTRDTGPLLFVLGALWLIAAWASPPPARLVPSGLAAASGWVRAGLVAAGAGALASSIAGGALPSTVGKWALLALASGLAGRVLVAGAARVVVRRVPPVEAAVVGSGETAKAITRVLARDKRLGLRLRSEGLPAEAAVAESSQVIIVALDGPCHRDLMPALGKLAACGREVWVSSSLMPPTNRLRVTDHLLGYPLARLEPDPGASFRRAVDVVLAAAGLIVAAPVMAAVGALVWADLGRPLLYRQQRLTEDGRRFQILKFRTMRPCDPGRDDIEWTASEERISAIGKFLRAWSLDELPQLVNVMRGEMALVGPRPERPFFADLFAARYPDFQRRLEVPAGITGLAQIEGLRGDSSIEDRLRVDRYYIDNRSLVLDVEIIARTLAASKGGCAMQEKSPGRDRPLRRARSLIRSGVAGAFALLVLLPLRALAQTEPYSGDTPGLTEIRRGPVDPGIDPGLPVTGGDVVVWIAIGLSAVMVGMVLLRFARRRRAASRGVS